MSEIFEMDYRDIELTIPHRPPFLLIDKVINIVPGQTATGVKAVSGGEPYFKGHFPGNPIMPGVLIIEAMAQTAGAICARRHSMGERKLVYFMTIDGAKFRRPVIPGDVLELRVVKQKPRKNIFKYHCEAWVGDEKAAEADIGAMMVDPEGRD